MTARAQLLPEEMRGLIETLYFGNLTLDDLKTARRPPGTPPLSMPLVNLALDDPIEAANRLLTLHQTAHGSLAQQLRAACTNGFGDPTDLKTAPPAPLEVPDTVPEAVRPAVAQLAGEIEEANNAVHQALSKLTEDEKRDLIESLPRWASPDPSFEPDFAKRPQLSQRQLLALVQKVDLPAIRHAARKLATGVEAQLETLKKNAGAVTTQMDFTVHGVVVELTGPGQVAHVTRDTNLCIAFGGDNTYAGRYGAGVGYASVLIDLGQRDITQGPDANFGAGILGIGLAYFAGEGDCQFGAGPGGGVSGNGSLSYGVGLCGVGGLSRHGGDDRYHAGTLAEGAAAFGIGILLDSDGDDEFTASTGAQGFARTGGVGWLIKQAGVGDFRTDSGQGLGAGVKTADGMVPGGAGLLTDLVGQATLIGGTRCQACAVTGGLGSAYLGVGRHTLSATDEAQANAQQTAAAYLFDLGGDDSFDLHGGLGHATAVDRSVALLLNRSGNDLYSSMDAHPGTAIDGSLAIFLDDAGNDRYQNDVSVGFEARGPASIGVFADLGGSDGYGSAESFEGQASVQPGLKIAYDAPTPPEALNVAQLPDHRPPAPGTAPLRSDAEMEQLYRQSVGDSVFTPAIDDLIRIGAPAFQWLMARELTSEEENRNRPFVALATALGKPAQSRLAGMVADPDDARALAALNICIEGGFDASSYLPAAIQRPALQRSAIAGAAAFNAQGMIKALLPLASSADPTIVYAALAALEGLKSREGLPIAQGYLTTSDNVVREAAMTYFARFPNDAIGAARLLMQSSDERVDRIGVEILSKVGFGEALDLIVPYLSKGAMGLKIQALLALNGRCPTEGRTAFLALRDDPNALVKAIASRTDPGR